MNERWFKQAVIYSLDVETFQDSNGDGVGDIPGLIARLDYLARLGVTCIWLHPIHPTPDRDDRYDVEKLGAPERDSEQEDSDPLLLAELRRAVRGKENDPVVQALLLGKGPRHVAEALGLKPAAARQRLLRARKRLKAALAQLRINA